MYSEWTPSVEAGDDRPLRENRSRKMDDDHLKQVAVTQLRFADEREQHDYEQLSGEYYAGERLRTRMIAAKAAMQLPLPSKTPPAKAAIPKAATNVPGPKAQGGAKSRCRQQSQSSKPGESGEYAEGEEEENEPVVTGNKQHPAQPVVTGDSNPTRDIDVSRCPSGADRRRRRRSESDDHDDQSDCVKHMGRSTQPMPPVGTEIPAIQPPQRQDLEPTTKPVNVVPSKKLVARKGSPPHPHNRSHLQKVQGNPLSRFVVQETSE